MEVLFCDNHILVVNKPAGLPTQLEEGDSLHSIAKAWIKKTYQKPGNVFLEPIHRLDKPVSGLVLFARTSKALSRLNEKMRERQILKTYFATVNGIPEKKEALLEHFLMHDAFCARVVNQTHPGAKKAVLEYRMIGENKGNGVLEIKLHTGRYHQIRVQMATIGHPILYDQKYGGGPETGSGAIALHHGQLEFLHPITQEIMKFTILAPK